jgi:hypothetical protein
MFSINNQLFINPVQRAVQKIGVELACLACAAGREHKIRTAA